MTCIFQSIVDDLTVLPNTIDIAVTQPSPNVVTMVPMLGTDMEKWESFEMFNSLCGLYAQSIGGSMTGIFKDHCTGLTKMNMYPHWVYLIKAYTRFEWKLKSKIQKNTKKLFENSEKSLSTLHHKQTDQPTKSFIYFRDYLSKSFRS